MRTFIFAGITLSVFLLVDSNKLPSSWGRCHKSDNSFSECVRKNIEVAVRSLNKPTPELGLTTFDPLDIHDLYIREGKLVNVTQHFKKLQLHGITNVQILKTEVDFKDKQIRTTSLNPELRLQGEYEMKGKVIMLPIEGQGPCNITLINMKINHVITWENVDRQGKSYMKIVSFTTKMNPEKVVFKFDNLFDGQKDLGDNVNNVLNENQEEIFNDVKAGYEKSFGQIFLNLANKVFTKVPQNEIFLD